MKKVPATVVTGFLGAGKTTLVRHLLANAHGRRIALIVNEFGDEGVDGSLLAACDLPGCAEEDIVELANGCLCCTVADEFLPTIEKLLDRPAPPDHIVIETSGLALPKPLVKAFDWPSIRPRVTVDGVVVVVDGPAFAAGRFASSPEEMARPDHDNPIEETFVEQLGCADLVLLNKSDLIPAYAFPEVEAALLAKLRPGVRLVATRHGIADARLLLGLDAAAEDDLAARPSLHDSAHRPRSRRFRQFRRSARRGGRPRRRAGAASPGVGDPRHPAPQGLPRRRRQGDAPCGAGGGRAHLGLLRPSLGRP